MSGKLLGGRRVSIKGRGGGGSEDTRVMGLRHTGLPLKHLNIPSEVRPTLGSQGACPRRP